MAQEHDEGFWIRTEPSQDGTTFVVTLSIEQDFAITLTPGTASQYASALLAAAADAEYDAAIMRQLTERLGVPDDAAGQVINDLRKERPERFASGIVFTGGVSLFNNGRPFIQIVRKDKTIGQFDTPAARRHALHVLEAVAGADLDTAYLEVLRNAIGINENTARQVVEDISNFRQEWAVSDE